MSEQEKQYGWVCPKCGVVLAPWVPQCNCVKHYINPMFQPPYRVGDPLWHYQPVYYTFPVTCGSSPLMSEAK